MKKALVLLCFVYLTINLFAFSADDYKIYSKKSQTWISLDQLVGEAQEADVFFFGELHDDSLMHYLEIELLKKLYTNNQKIAVSMEMFERDTQQVLDQYFAYQITEEEMIKQSRAWPNYISDYQPIVAFAKEKKIPFIASNVPRRIASLVNKKGIGILDSLDTQDRRFIAKNIQIADSLYEKKFIGLMKESIVMPKSHSMMNNAVLINLFHAQCVKDETMAESINQFLAKNPSFKVIHYNGDFHSNSHLGTVSRINKAYKSLVLTPVIVESIDNIELPEPQLQQQGDFLLYQKQHH